MSYRLQKNHLIWLSFTNPAAENIITNHNFSFELRLITSFQQAATDVESSKKTQSLNWTVKNISQTQVTRCSVG